MGSVGTMTGLAGQLVVEWRSADVQVTARAGSGAVVATAMVAPESNLDATCSDLLSSLDSLGGAASVVVNALPGLVVVDTTGAALAVLVGDEPDTTPDAGWLAGRLPGKADDWVAAVGSAPAASWMLAKLSYVHRAMAAEWAAMAQALTPQAWLVHQLTGAATTDAADMLRTGVWAMGAYQHQLLAIVDPAVKWPDLLPAVSAEGELGRWRGVPVLGA